MLDAIEAVLLLILPWSFVAKTLALGFMGWHLNYRTSKPGPVGAKINVEFRDQTIMSLLITWAMFIISRQIDATEIDWPFVTLALLGLALWPLRTAWSHYDVFRTYRRQQRVRTGRYANDGRSGPPDR